MKTNQLNTPSLITGVALAAFLSLLNPLDLAKNRLQTMPELIAHGHLQSSYKNPLDCLKNVTKREGVKALWKGNGVGLMRFFPNQYLNVSVKRIVRSFFNPSITINYASGVLAGWTATAVLYPMDTLRVLLTNQVNNVTGFTDTLRNVVRGRGFMSFYRGFASSLIGIALFRGSFYGTYDTFKVKSNSYFWKWCSAYFASIFASFLTYPLDTARRRKIMANSDASVYRYLYQIWKQEGIKALFRGGSIIAIQSIAASFVLLFLDSDKI